MALTWIRGLVKSPFDEFETFDLLEGEDPQRKAIVEYLPIGVVAAITPWNFPIQLACSKIAAAVLTGNSVIVKPSPHTPYTTIKIVELAQYFFPAGLVQIIAGDNEVGRYLSSHPSIGKVSVTGSVPTGKSIMREASESLKSLTLEL